ncbi:hypothetical protein Tco_0550463 [Tanacetum coccineum]
MESSSSNSEKRELQQIQQKEKQLHSKVENVETYGQDFMEEIMVKRANEKADIFSKSDYKYLNKNDIEDMVHDYQLGIESYHIKINLTAGTLVYPGIEALEPYTIITDPFISIAYENNKKERRVMNIHELPKFCKANRVLNKIEKILLKAKHGLKEPPLSKEHKEVMELFEGEIDERLKFRRHVRKMGELYRGKIT